MSRSSVPALHIQQEITEGKKFAKQREMFNRLLRDLCNLLKRADYVENDPRAVPLLRRMIAILKSCPDEAQMARLAVTTQSLEDPELNILCCWLGLEPFLTTEQLKDPRPLGEATNGDPAPVEPVGKIYFKHTSKPAHWDAGITSAPSGIIPAKPDGHCGAHSVANVLRAHSQKDPLFLEMLQIRRDALDIAERREALQGLQGRLFEGVSTLPLEDTYRALLSIADDLIAANEHGDTYLQEHLDGGDKLRQPSNDNLGKLIDKLCVRASIDADLYALLLEKLAISFTSPVSAMTRPGIGVFTEVDNADGIELPAPQVVPVSAQAKFTVKSGF